MGVQVTSIELDEALAGLARFRAEPPVLGVVLGSGLAGFADMLSDAQVVPMSSIPHVAVPQVPGHAKNLCFGRIGSVRLACFSGRVHAYEGHSLDKVVLPVRILAALGCKAVLLTNAAGGIRDDLRAGDLMLISDHINLTGRNPLVGPNQPGLPRFPDMSEVYDAELRTLARDAASAANLDLKEGVYAGMLGPSYETPAEIRMLRTLGADAVGMSTVFEAITLRQLSVRVAGVSAITNKAAGLSAQKLDHAEVEATAARIQRVFVEFLSRWATLCSLELTA
jgi:purine-nucleoside phosphorylase